MSDDVLIRAEGVSKKFCRSLKRSLWYGIKDTVGDLLGRDSNSPGLRDDEFWAVKDVSFELRRGECLGLIGRNGAGKTTLLRILNGLIKPDQGRIEMRGRIGALIALGAGFNPILTGRENIYVNGSVLGLSKKEIDAKYDEIIDFADIGDFIDAPVQSYSSGMVVRLGFAVAAAVEPDILLLDEVLAVGDLNFQAKCFNALAKFRERGTGFIFVSHNMHLISRYCQEVLYIRRGQVEHQGEVTIGVAKYLKDLDSESDEVNAGPDWAKPLGSGIIRLVGSQFLNAKDDPISEIDIGEPLTLMLKYECLDGVVKSADLDLIIRDQDDIIYQGSNQTCGSPFGDFLNNGQIRIKFAYIPLNVDYLDFSFALLDRVTGEIYDWKRNLRLLVRRNANHQGKIVLPTKWTMTTLNRTEHLAPEGHGAR
jgi:ABC-type polysaccharide/polyol phosphate transport system ATPase subunit